MADNFRQTVEEILDGLCLQCPFEETITVEFRNIAVDHICEAVLKMAEGMPKRPTILIHTSNDRFVVPTMETRKQLQQIEDAEKEYLSECQDHLRKQVE